MKLTKIVTLFALILCFFSTDKAMEGPGQHQDETESRPTKRRRTEQTTSNDNTLIEALRAGDIHTFNDITDVVGFDDVTNQTLKELLIIARKRAPQKIVDDIELELKNRSNKDYCNRLRAAIEHDDLAELEKIIDQKGIDYNYAHIFDAERDQDGQLQEETQEETITAMSIAAETDQPKATLIRWLIDHGASVNEGALYHALKHRDYDLALYALNRGAYTITFHGDPTELDFLFDNGAFNRDTLNYILVELMTKSDDTSFLKYAQRLLLRGFYLPSRPGSSQLHILPDDITRLDWAHTLTPQRGTYDEYHVVSTFVNYFFKKSPISAALILLRGDNQVPEIKSFIDRALFLQNTIQKLLAGGATSLKTILQQTETIVLESIGQALDAPQIKSHLETSYILDEDLILQIKTSLERAIRLQTDIHTLIKGAAPDDESLTAITDILTNVEKLTLHRISTVLGETGIDDQFTTLSIPRLEETHASEIQGSLDTILSGTRDFNESSIRQLIEKARQAIITDVNNALIFAAGQNTQAPTILAQADLLTPETYSEALLAAGLNNHMDMFSLLIDHATTLTNDQLKPVLQKLLRPLIIRGNSEFFQTLLQIAFRRRIILDLLPEEKEDEGAEEKKVTSIAELIDILLASPTISTSAEKRTQYQQIRYHLMEHIRRRAYVRRLEETPYVASQDNIIPRENLPVELQRPKSRFAPVEYYQLPRVQGLMPRLPADIMRYIISFVLANYMLGRPGGK